MLVSTLLDRLQSDPGRPRLTWYGDDGERVELSGAVLANWVAKTTNLLVEEYDVQPGSMVGVDLPVHWRTVTWALAAWRVGATVVLTGDSRAAAAEDLDVVVTDSPERWAASSADLVVVSLPALARRYDGDLPPGAMDAAAAVMTYADQVIYAPEPEPGRVALTDTAGDPAGSGTAGSPTAAGVRHDELVPEPDGEAARTLVDGRAGTAVVLRELLRTWAGAGSVVLTSPATAAALDADTARRDRLVTTEKIEKIG
ncbi:TIGR03089 family protein [Myceligenerans pegani]|uniref:TIGR03089 family protein n=1 Tax=Myceligenerans pegani TaxID=2776917 RepID=A0ABR9MYE9_9MICO|nr:TIGR03089 family protein [Myceligenerans sp. TRM 65318]MBE1876392.1 TIGR03089 family protein [Myceligenerans sp. TRM 65318]MBE3018663.1 TIGR03089 family protein [Myceligenerans sp. TRM 65318]